MESGGLVSDDPHHPPSRCHEGCRRQARLCARNRRAL
jgi:hypothetical protein